MTRPSGEGEYVNWGGGEYVDQTVPPPTTKGWLVDEAVRDEHGTWHHSRCGISTEPAPAPVVLAYYLAYCGAEVLPGYGWRDAKAVPRRARCKLCDWSNL